MKGAITMKRRANIALLLSLIALPGGLFISNWIAYIFGAVGIILSATAMKTAKRTCIIAIVISGLAILLPFFAALALVIALKDF
jgi:heme O synthase-like polyprenyltransferase